MLGRGIGLLQAKWSTIKTKKHYIINMLANVLALFRPNGAICKLKKHYNKHVDKGIGPLQAKWGTTKTLKNTMKNMLENALALFGPNRALCKLKSTIINMLSNVLTLFRPNGALSKQNKKCRQKGLPNKKHLSKCQIKVFNLFWTNGALP